MENCKLPEFPNMGLEKVCPTFCVGPNFCEVEASAEKLVPAILIKLFEPIVLLGVGFRDEPILNKIYQKY